MKADLRIAFDALDLTPRWKQNLKDFEAFYPTLKKEYGVDIIFSVGHSLAGGISDLFIDKGYVSQGISYNPAVKKRFMGSNKNYRIHLNNSEVLYQTMGKYANPESREVRETSTTKRKLNETGDLGKTGVALQSH